ncbi:MAG: hypothetical protein U9P44_03275, partial [archaeon]|nr:hypothetical protein [archaeon]
MSGECVSYDCPPCGDLCSTPYALPASPTAVSSGNTPEIYLSTASKDMYGIEKEAIEIYLKKVLNAENIYDLLENTTINSTDNLPYGTLGMISSTVQYNPVTGKKNPVRSDIFYDSTLPEDLQIYALLHELTHLEQLNYNSNMPLSFSEGDAEYNASALTGNGLDTIYDTEKGIFYNADKTYEKCKETVTGIYKAIGDGDIDSGRKQFYKAIERFGGDFYTALDSFDTSLNKDGINPEQIYDQLDSLDLEITQK